MSGSSTDGSGVPGHTTTMEVGVVARIADLAARTVPGVVTADGGAPTATVRLGETHATVDLALVATHGADLLALAAEVRRTVAASVEEMTDLRVTAVDVTVVDVREEPAGR